MVEELKLAIKVDDDSIEQSLLKQFANAQKMADKVVFTFNNVNLDNKNIEKQFKDMQKMAGNNPIELPVDTDKAMEMLKSLGSEFTKILDIAKGRSFIDSASTIDDINKIENKIDELDKKYNKSQKKKSSNKTDSNVISTSDLNNAYKINNALNETVLKMSNLQNGSELPDDFNKLESDVKSLNQQLTQGEITVKEYAKQFNILYNDAVKLSSQTDLDKIISKNGTRITNLQNSKPVEDDRSGLYQGYINHLNTIQEKLKSIQNEVNAKGFITDADIKKAEDLQKEYTEIDNTIKQMKTSAKGSTEASRQKEIDKLNKAMQANTNITAEARKQLEHYLSELRNGDASTNVEEIHTAWQKVINDEIAAGRGGTSFIQMMKNSGIHKWAADIAGMFSFYDVVNIGKQGLQIIHELDTALTEMRKVSDETVQSLKDYQSITFDTADAVGTTAKQIQNSTADWMRLGESMSDAAESAKDANILLNVSEFEGIDEATESLVSMSQAYKDLDKMDIIDVLNNIGNNYSISTDGLATALKDSASALVTANNDLNEAVSLTTAGNAITQDPSKVGAGLRTISLRLVGTEAAKQELSDLGEETDGMITTVSKLRDTIKSATAAATEDGKGFDILDANGNYKSTYEIMQGLADLYDNIVAKDKEFGTNNLNLLLETIAGKNRSNIAASILQNGEMLKSVYEDAQNSEGSAEQELNSYLDSIDGKIAQLQNRVQEFWFKVIDSETIKNGIDLLTTLTKGATDFVDTVGVLPTIITGITTVLSAKNNFGKCYVSA